MIKVLPLVGPKAYSALIAVQKLLIGLKMLPEYEKTPYAEFFESFREMDDSEKEVMIRLAAAFVELTVEELQAIVCFGCDKNGIAYTAANLKNLKPDEIFEIIVAVAIEISLIKITMVSAEEKKKLNLSQST